MKKDIIQKSDIGKGGRFGNQLQEYIFGKAYAVKYNCKYQIPADWCGWKIFDLEDEVITENLPAYRDCGEKNFPWGIKNVNLLGMFYQQNYFDICTVDQIKSWLKFKKKYYVAYPKYKEFYVCCHLRKTDFSFQISKQSYLKFLNSLGYHEDDIVFVSDDPYHADYLPQQPIDEFSFLRDFFVIMNADILLRSNSTFSFYGSVLGNAKTYSPQVFNMGIGFDRDVNFVEGNSEHMCSFHSNDADHLLEAKGIMYRR